LNDKEQRRHWLWGLSPGNVIAILIVLSSGLVSWGYTQAQVLDNEKDIIEVKKEFNVKLDKVEKKITDQIITTDKRSQANFRELRKIVIEGIKRGK